MMTYNIDILDVQSGEVKRVDSFVGWTEYSPKTYRENMCDCNLAAMRNREFAIQKDGQRRIQDCTHAAYDWRRDNGGCDHLMPPTRMKAVRAYLQDGRVWDFHNGEFVKAAA